MKDLHFCVEIQWRKHEWGESGAATNAGRKEADVSEGLKNLLTAVRLCQHFPPNGASPRALANNRVPGAAPLR